jgi:predicted DNA binding protein
MDLAVEIRQLVRYGEDTRVTGKQRELVKTALDQGFYDYPKKVGVKELAAQTKMAPSTVAEILRRAQKNILLDYFNFKK